jgi:xanthine/uracil permease
VGEVVVNTAEVVKFIAVGLIVLALTPVSNYFRRRGRMSAILVGLFWLVLVAVLVGIWQWMRWSILREIHH